MPAKPPVIMVMGPTGCGKTEAAIHCVQHLPGDLISVDSALVYRGLDVGTAKPDAQTLIAYPHRLVDIVDPTQCYSAGQFRDDAISHINEITKAGRLPILVGGTMLYFRVLQEGIATLPRADPDLRARLDKQGSEQGWPVLHDELKQVDPEAAARIHPNDAQRIQRALEVLMVSGDTLTHWHTKQAETGFELAFQPIKVCLSPTHRESLYTALEIRFNEMIKKGFLQEVRGLYERGDLHGDSPALRSVGYRQLWRHVAGEIDLASACSEAIKATRRLAKRQLTWLRKEKNLHRVDAQSPRAKQEVLRDITLQLKAFGYPCDTLRP